MNARTSILAAANPVDSLFNEKKTIIENLRLPPSLISRFDLIFLILDIPNEKRDKCLAKHLLDLYSKGNVEVEEKNILDTHFFS